MTEYVAAAIFVVTIGLVFTDRMHRLVASAAGAAVMMAAGRALGFYTEEQAVEAIDFETLGLLLGMMIVVRLLEQTGFFEYMAIIAARRSGGQPWRLLVLLGTTTTVLSLFLDNVTTVVLIAPLTVLVAEILGLNPIPLLISEALLSDTGGVATLVGDPPNVLIGSAAGLSFMSFLTHLAPIVAVAWFVALLLLRWLFRAELAKPAVNISALQRLDANEALQNPKDLRRLLIVLFGVVALFLVQGSLGVSPAMVALSGAAVAMVWVQPNVHAMLREIEWSVLLFFICLFVIVGGLETAGSLHAVSSSLFGLGHVDPIWVGVSIMWGVALLSAVLDNIPVTIAMIPVIWELEATGMNVTPLWWALALGAGMGGNGTIIGSTANIVVVSISERTQSPITPQLWMRRGMPVMIATLIVSTVMYVLAFPWMSTK